MARLKYTIADKWLRNVLVCGGVEICTRRCEDNTSREFWFYTLLCSSKRSFGSCFEKNCIFVQMVVIGKKTAVNGQIHGLRSDQITIEKIGCFRVGTLIYGLNCAILVLNSVYRSS